MRAPQRSRQAGSTAVEFALVLLIFLTFMLAITDFSRMLFTWNAATEATRAGARYAVVCDTTAEKAKVLAKMQAMLPQITDIKLDWEDDKGALNTCSPSNCLGVTVTIVGLNYQWISPIAGAVAMSPIAMPTFSTFLSREVMGSDPNSYSGANICS
jgi:Flp pilus assembly protein TadG